MTVRMHPDPGFLLEYSSGGLSPAMCVSVSAHLHFCETCRSHQADLDEIGGTLLEDVQPESLNPLAFDELMAELDRSVANPVTKRASVATQIFPELQALPEMVLGLIPELGPKWQFLSPSLQVAKLPVGEDKYELALHRIKAGGKTPSHDHRGMEVTVVVKGSFSDDDGVYNEGDFLLRRPGDIHRPMANQEECICISVVEAPIRLVGSFSRFLNPFFSFNPQ